MPALKRLRGGIQAANVNTIMKQEGDLNRFYNYYLGKAVEAMPSVIAAEVPSGSSITNSIIVIDMQNDFVLPHPLGAFSVAGGDNIVEPMRAFIHKNAKNCTKVIFSRDSHHPDHCSFMTRNGPFPPHCAINSPGAELHPGMMEFSALPNAAVIFKGMNKDVDSFGAFQYPDNSYSAGRQIGDNCCPDSKASGMLGKCVDATGGFYLNNLSTEEAFGPTPFSESDVTAKFQISDLLRGDETEHNVFIVGLAGDYCVRDTAINIASQGAVNGVKINVYVIQPLTRYAFVPLAVGYPPIQPADLAEQKTNGVRKHLNKYAFGLGAGGFEIISSEKAASIQDEEIKAMNPPQYFHFLTDPREIIQNYKDAGVSILMSVPSLLATNGGKRRKSRKTKKGKNKTKKNRRV